MPRRLGSTQLDLLNALRPQGIFQRVEIARTSLRAALATCQPSRCNKCCAVITADRPASRGNASAQTAPPACGKISENSDLPMGRGPDRSR